MRSMFFLCAALLASCGLPASLDVGGTPAINLPLGYIFSGADGKNSLLDEYFNRDTILKNLDRPGSHVWNYEYHAITVDGQGATVNGDPETASPEPAQTYLILYPIVKLDAGIPGFTIPEITTKGPGFGTMLGTLSGIQFRYVWCYILVGGIEDNPATKIALFVEVPEEFEDYEYTATDYTTVSDDKTGKTIRCVKLLPNENLTNAAFVPADDDKPYTGAISGESARGFSLAPLFRHNAASPAMRITITNATLSGGEIDITMLIVLPLVFDVPPAQDKDGNPQYIKIKDTDYVMMNVKQLNNFNFDLSDFGSKVNTASVQVDHIKNDVFSNMYLGVSTGLDDNGYIWSDSLIDLNEGAVNEPVDITGVSRIPKMALLTEAVEVNNKMGSLQIKPARKDGVNEFDFMVTLDAATDFSQRIRF